jgi:hypothetical protein
MEPEIVGHMVLYGKENGAAEDAEDRFAILMREHLEVSCEIFSGDAEGFKLPNGLPESLGGDEAWDVLMEKMCLEEIEE